jgi:hypothetical protein
MVGGSGDSLASSTGAVEDFQREMAESVSVSTAPVGWTLDILTNPDDSGMSLEDSTGPVPLAGGSLKQACAPVLVA